MPHKLIKEKEVDIFQLPFFDVSHEGQTGIQITIGDLHGNAMKLMFMLVKHGIATNINETDYNRLVAIYKIPIKNLTKNHLDEFNQILSKLNFSKKSLIRLIGDELADRGNNDYFTLKILEKMSEHHIPVEIIISNHSIEFVEACEKKINFHASMLSNELALSIENLQRLVEKGIVAREDILAIADKSYKPTLRAISYSLSYDKKEITIYSHAGIGLNTVKSLAKKLEVTYNDATADELAKTINNINLQFQKHVQHKTVHTLYTRKNMHRGYSGQSDLIDGPFEFIMWNRLYDRIKRPAVYSGYKINFVHGHDSKEKTQHNIYNLDNKLGKAEFKNKGTYTVLYSQEVAMASAIRPVEISETGVLTPVNHEIKPTVSNLSQPHQHFLAKLEEINEKEKHLRGNGYIEAANDARDLHETINNTYEKLIEKTITIEKFKEDCIKAIEKAQPTLEKHWDWKKVLGNLVFSIVGLGVFYAIAEVINKAITKNFLFFKTDTANKIDPLNQSIKSMNEPK